MSNKVVKLILKAKKNLIKKLKFKFSKVSIDSSIQQDQSYFSVTIVDYPKSVTNTTLEPIHALKKQFATTQLVNLISLKAIEDTFFDVSELPFLLASPEINRSKPKVICDLKSIIDIKQFDESLEFDNFEAELEIDQLNTAGFENDLNDSYIMASLEDTIDSLNNLQNRHEDHQDECNSNFSQMYQDSFGFKSNDFHSINSKFF